MATRKNLKHRIAARRERAAERRAARETRSALEQIALCESRRGNCKKELARLNAELEP